MPGRHGESTVSAAGLALVPGLGLHHYVKDAKARWQASAVDEGKIADSYLNCSFWPSHTVPTQAMPALLSHSVLIPLRVSVGAT